MTMRQEEGVIGRAVGTMIRRTVRNRFRSVRICQLAPFPESRPLVFAANHNGWHDGYLMYCLVTHLRVPSLDWIAEYDSFPLFGKVGGMPFPADDPVARTRTLRSTIRQMTQGRSLVLFAEGVLHCGPGILPFSRVLETLARSVPSLIVVPVGIRYTMGIHERPEATVGVGARLSGVESLALRTQEGVMSILDHLDSNPGCGEILVQGKRDVNERLAWPRGRRP